MSEMIEKNPNFPDPLPQSVLKNLEAISRITESIQPVLRQQEIIQNFAETVKLSLPKMDFYLPAVEIAKQIQIPVMRMSEVFSGYQLNSALTSSL